MARSEARSAASAARPGAFLAGLILLAATAVVAATGGWQLNRAYPDAADLLTATVLPGEFVIDARGPLAFDQGHIPGAANIWARDLLSFRGATPGMLADSPDLEERLKHGGVWSDSSLVVYDQGDGAEAPLLALVLHAFGIEARVLEGGYNAWLPGGVGPETGRQDTNPNMTEITWTFDSRLLVDTGVIAEHLATGLVVALDARSAGAYAEGHVALAVNLPASSLAPGGALPRWADAARLLDAARISEDTHLLVYGEDAAEAARAWLALRAFGRTHLHVVAGTFDALPALGLEITREAAPSAVSIESSSVCWGAQ